MAVRYDPTTDRLHLAVGDLLWVERKADPNITGNLADRSEIGREIHIRHSEQRASVIESHRSEIEIECPFTVDGAQVMVHGRMDGMWETDSGLCIEEIKSTFANASLLPFPSHLMQMQLYLVLASQLYGRAVHGLLTYLHPSRGRTAQVAQGPDAGIHDELLRRLGLMVGWHRREAQRLMQRASCANDLRWPYPSDRPGQGEIREAVQHCIAERKHLLISAPTGSGKTAPILLTAMQEAMRGGTRLFFATSRTAQQAERVELILQAFPSGSAGRILLLTAREKLRDSFSPADDNPEALDPYDPPDWFLTFLECEPVVGADAIRKCSEIQQIDPVALQHEVARYADVLIGDINLLALPGGGISPLDRAGRDTLLLIDEAHGLPDRLRDRSSARLLPREVRRLADRIDTFPSPLSGELYSVLRELYSRLRSRLTLPEGIEVPAYERCETADQHYSSLIQHSAMLLGSFEGYDHDDLTRGTINQLRRASAAVSEPEGYAAYLDWRESALCWELAETAPVMRFHTSRFYSVIAFSATLEPLESARDDLGLEPNRTELLRLPDPFGPDQRLVLRCTAFDTLYRFREETAAGIASLLNSCTRATGGRWLVFFPSRAYLEMVERELSAIDCATFALVGNIPQRLLEKMYQKVQGPSIHLALLGGALAEGINPVEGHYDGLAVISIGMPPQSPRAELLRSVTEERGESGLLKAYLLPGLKRVQQAAGRLIRSPEQRGVLLLVDPRFARPEIASLLPPSIAESEVYGEPAPLLERIESWWSRVG